ncbi:MAG: hypothetical protein Q8J61_03650, partial [Sulfuricella sp.]|nr:hypothetical protein [Sulfuricella sp.]
MGKSLGDLLEGECGLVAQRALQLRVMGQIHHALGAPAQNAGDRESADALQHAGLSISHLERLFDCQYRLITQGSQQAQLVLGDGDIACLFFVRVDQCYRHVLDVERK